MHITSLPSPYGIGTLGKEAEKFADWLQRAGQSWWQVLPSVLRVTEIRRISLFRRLRGIR